MPKSISVRDRLLAKVRKTPDGCWQWTAVADNGYGRFHYLGRHARAHRVSYELFVGPIPKGLQLDHLCRNRACINPEHLEPVTQRENILRGTGWAARNAAKTHCNAGHLFDEQNTRLEGTGQVRRCRTCRRATNARADRRARDAAA